MTILFVCVFLITGHEFLTENLLTIPLLKAMFVVVFFLTKEDEILTV
jgi:hypothetical protein